MKSLTLGLLLVMMVQFRVHACENCSTPDASEKRSSLVPSGCSLSDVALSERILEMEALISLRKEVRELENGYALRFPGDETELAARLANWIITERQCCSFLEFELSFAAEHGPIWLTIDGSQEAKMFVAFLIGTSKEKP